MMNLGFEPPFLGRIHRPYRIVNAAPSIIELAKSRMSNGQIR
jgi:hypothetical protein